eukprot:Polyplicarium_translucidae@DN4536_c0_g1_i1.p1
MPPDASQLPRLTQASSSASLLSGGGPLLPAAGRAGSEARRRTAAGEPVVVPPLVLCQLLPLLEGFLMVQQLLLCADLHVTSVTPAQLGIPLNGSAPQAVRAALLRPNRLTEAVQALLWDPNAELPQRLRAIHNFCDRHRKAINSLIGQNAALLMGSLHPLLSLAPMSVNIDNKQIFLRQRIRQSKEGQRFDSVRLSVRREHVFTDSYHQLRMRSGEEMKGKLSVDFQGEDGVDAGGVAREWFEILAREMFNPNYALFRREGSKAEFNHPNPLSTVNPDHLDFFKFIGRVLGKAVYDGHYLEAYFTRSFYKLMLGRKTTFSDAEVMDPELYKNLQLLLENSIDALELGVTFSTTIDEFGSTKVVDLMPNGRDIPVTESNKHDYVRLMCEHKINHGIQDQCEAFLGGFHELVPADFLSIFDDKELELLISGLKHIDLQDLKNHTEYHGYTLDSPQIKWFWEVLEDCDHDRRAGFLQFVTGTSRVPTGGFQDLMGMRGPQRFSIHRIAGNNRLPSAHTCFNQLELPEYQSKKQLKEKLLKAVTEGKEGFGFV